ncbi:MAG: hypothetical protein PHC51_06295 [bacterium]|nr:hypothetical protein [bacterium]
MIDLLLSAATLASNAACSADEGFRARDLKFLGELFSNWIEHSFSGGIVSLHNNQVRRFLISLEVDGYLRRVSESTSQSYRLTRLGVLELASRLSADKHSIDPARFLFCYQIVRLYGEVVMNMVRREGKSFPESLRLELEGLLDHHSMLRREITMVSKATDSYRQRAEKGKRVAVLARALISQGLYGKNLYAEIERDYPYNLSATKPLSQVLAGLPSGLAEREITNGALSRAEYLWHPLGHIMQAYLKTLLGILERN